MLFAGDGPAEIFVNVTVPGIKAAIADHFIMLFRDMTDQAFYKLHDGNGFFHILIIFMAVIVEGYKVPIILIDP